MTRRAAPRAGLVALTIVACACGGAGGSATDAPAPPEAVVLFEWYPTGGDSKTIVVSDLDPATPDHAVVPDGGGAEVHATWSPDGRHIAWEVLGDDGTASVWTAAADGSGAAETVRCPADPCVEVSYPAYSPDGGRLLVARYDRTGTGRWGPSHLVIADLATGEQRIIASTADGTTSFYSATWSPDGRRVAAQLEGYATDEQTTIERSVVVVVDTDPATSDPPVEITDPALFAGYPRWHPTDDRILFASWDLDAFQGDEPSQLHVIGPDGSGLRTITGVDHTASGWRPGEATWSPDGAWIIAALGIVEGGRIVDLDIAWIDPEDGSITPTGVAGAMPVVRP